MADLMVAFTDRSGTDWAPPKGLTFAVQRLAQHRLLHHKAATIQVAGGDPDALYELLERLRYKVKIYAANKPLVCQGFIDTVEVNDHGSIWGVSLDGMYNRVAVAYGYIAPGSNTVGERRTTPWAEDAASIAEFGVKEMLLSLDGTTDQGALQMRDTFLAAHSLPVGVTSDSGFDPGGVTATISCAGWFSTLGWKYYKKTSEDSKATSEQIRDILATAGQFFSTVTVEPASSIYSSEKRLGDKTALVEALELMQMGTVNGRSYQVEIDARMNVRVVEAPDAEQVSYYRRSDGRMLANDDRLIDGYQVEAGRWVQHKNAIPKSVDTTCLRSVGAYLIDEVEWHAARPDVPVLTPTGARGDVVSLVGGGGSGYSLPKVQAQLFESGAYTPEPVGLTDPVIASANGYYRIHGDVCTVWGRLDITSWSGASGRIQITLPVEPALNQYVVGTFMYYRAGGSTNEGNQAAITYNGYLSVRNAAGSDMIYWEASSRVLLYWFAEYPVSA